MMIMLIASAVKTSMVREGNAAPRMYFEKAVMPCPN